MALVTDHQVEELRAEIESLDLPTVHVDSVDVHDDDGPDGPAVIVKVTIAAVGSAQWAPADFRDVRRAARTAALNEFGSGVEVRMVYESPDSDPADDMDDDGRPSPTDGCDIE